MSQRLWKAPDIVPSLHYSDAVLAAEWLERAFGLRERKEARLVYAGGKRSWVEAGEGLVSLVSIAGQAPVQTLSNCKLKVYVDDVDTHFVRAEAQGARIVAGLFDGFWGGRLYRARDLDGYLWEFSQRGLDKAAEEWSLPPDHHLGT